MRSEYLAVCAVLAAGTAFGQVDLRARVNVDNAFTAYLSDTAGVQGTAFLTGNSWGTTFDGTIVINAPGTYYLQVLAQDFGLPEMFMGLFELNDASATFSNGTQSLFTETTDWVVSSTGFAGPFVTPADLGPNGAGPWGNFSYAGPGAHFIWHPQAVTPVYFQTVITVVPAPASIVMLGGVGLAGLRRRR